MNTASRPRALIALRTGRGTGEGFKALSAEYERNERILRRQHLKIDLGVLRCALVTEEGCNAPLYGVPAEKVDEVLEAFDWLREFHR